MELERGTLLGNNELLVRIGRGGMASVWVARTRPAPGEPERLIAIKAMLPELAKNMEFRAMFLDEGQIVGSIDHPNVVKVFDVGEEHGILFMAMEWIEGDSLHTLIAEANKRRPIPPEVAVRMIADTASGLHAAHELKGWDGEPKGIVHCDVSPHNILIGLDGAVKLVDFGVAGAMNQLPEDDEAKIRGKFGYMSPEQAQAQPLDRRSDVFSLGIVLFELTTGYRLFRGRDDRHTLELVTFGKIPRPSQVIGKYPAKLEAIVMKALERDLERRFQTADELRDALESYLVEERILVPSAGVKGLLRRVLGSKIDQRRQQIRGAVRSLDGSHPGAQLISEASVLDDSEAISVSVSQVEPVLATGDLSSPSGLGAARLPSDTSSGPQTLSQPSIATAAPRSSSAGFIIGALVGVVGAAAAFFVLNMQGDEPKVQEFSSQASAKSAARSGPTKRRPGEPESRGDTSTRGLSLDSLPADENASAHPANNQKNRERPKATDDELTREERIARDMDLLKKEEPKDDLTPTKVTLEEDSVDDIANRVKLTDTPEEPAKAGAPKSGGTGQGSAQAALGRAAGLVGLCRRPGGQSGPGTVLVTIGSGGSVQNVQVLPPYAGTPVGQCIASKFRRVKVPSYSGATVTLRKSFTIPE